MIINTDCFEYIKTIPDNSVDLVITSPPYSDIINYGKQVSVKKPDEYVDWLLPLHKDIHRVLKSSGSYILNINDTCSNGYRNTYVYDLISRNGKETPLKLYDSYVWHKLSGIPNGSNKRFRHMTEHLFHFCKDQKKMKFYIDRCLIPQSQATTDRLKYRWTIHLQQKVNENGERLKTDAVDLDYMTSGFIRPDNVFRFKTASSSRENTIRHPAPYHKELPTYFINFLTDEGDLVLDPFSGIGTTGIACKELNREYIGIELNKSYAEFSEKRLEGVIDKYVINQYTTDGNLVGTYKEWSDVSKKYGWERDEFRLDTALLRVGNSNKLRGFIWKKELDMNG